MNKVLPNDKYITCLPEIEEIQKIGNNDPACF